MGIGIVAISTTQKKEPVPQPGPPFTSNSADNGLSVDSVSGRIVLGNDLGDPAQPALLLSNREIVTEDPLFNLFSVTLNSILTGIATALDGQSVQITGGAGTFPLMSVSAGAGGFATSQAIAGAGGQAFVVASAGVGGSASLLVSRGGADTLAIQTNGAGSVFFLVGNTVQVWAVDTATFNQQAGPGLMAFNGAAFQINGSYTGRRFVQGQGAGAYNVSRDLDSAKLFVNSAAATFNLPNMAAGNNRLGFIFRLCITNVAGGIIQAFAGQVIRFGSLSTSAGGTLASVDVGAYVTIIWDGGQWLTETFNGAWTLT